MSLIRSILFLLFISLPVTASAGVTSDDLPNGTLWYLHADLAQMRTADSGRGIYEWLDGEVFMEIHDEVGIDINKETDSVTAYSTSESGTVIVIEGPLRSATQEKLIESARKEAELTDSKYKGMAYYFIKDRKGESDNDHEHGDHHRSREPLKDLKDGAYFSFAIKNKLLITGSEEQMKDLLDNRGKVAGSSSHNGALFVLTADKAFVQAGLKTNELDDDDDGWDSNILRNTEQLALTIAGIDDMILIEAQLVSTDPAMAQSLGGIANGLISLQAFNSELDPELKSLLLNTKIDVTDNVLSISTVITPDVIVKVLED